MPDPVTFINVIDVDSTKQQEVIDILTEGTEKVISRRPGFISVTILASADRGRVINIARWAGADDIEAIAAPGPGIYSVVSEFTS